MQLLYSSVLLAALAWPAASAPASEASSSKARSKAVAEARVPMAKLAYGTYHGKHNAHFNQDLFLGIPYAQPPTGSLRFAPPQPLVTSFEGPRNATEYGPLCIGYGGDTTALGDYVSEDCLTINIVRPAGVADGDDLPVAVWVHGGVSDHSP